MIKWVLAGVLALVVGFIAVISMYLAPNDLASCGASPDGVGKCKKVDAIVAISGGDTVARTAEAIKLYQNGWADQLLFSGAAQDTSGPSNAEAMRRQAIDAGVPNEAISVEETARSTAENAEQARQLFIQRGIHRVILVTSAYHQRRASLEFNKRTQGNVLVLNHPVADDIHWSGYWWLTPRGWWLAIGELAKITAFYLGSSR